ncbi:antibiotic biosynthesis monooxygenase [Pengzhenrongella frigida]|uniref:Antibiotic biosynthesis monooxygenase n=1 Tax=Pengzhenrongella frigida TaxID=1259133 RepID=A0A4Q5N0F3_9MICO|nr:antibiotic biosynthesis monooxygenase [Cellulomonas sp. HLT2-17]RYV49967.1 antibiotic biosynthesis monooxygenase [Cellulomonas sp. HLT2-17]
MFSIMVRFDLPDEAAAAAFDALAAEVVPSIREREPGTLLYLIHQVDGAPLSRAFYEIYRDRAAHAAHEARPEVAAFLTAVARLVTATRVEYLIPDGPSEAAWTRH